MKQLEKARTLAGEARKNASQEGRFDDERALIAEMRHLDDEMLKTNDRRKAYEESLLPLDEAERRLGNAAFEARNHVERMKRKAEALHRLRDLIGLLSRFATLFRA
jgi:predicted  nucleic acid-binding Zn-ribbon protein